MSEGHCAGEFRAFFMEFDKDREDLFLAKAQRRKDFNAIYLMLTNLMVWCKLKKGNFWG